VQVEHAPYHGTLKAKSAGETLNALLERDDAMPVYEIVRIGDDFFFSRFRQIVARWKARLLRLDAGEPRPDVPLNDVPDLLWKAELARQPNSLRHMLEPLGPHPSQVMKKGAGLDQVPVHPDGNPLAELKGQVTDRLTMGHKGVAGARASQNFESFIGRDKGCRRVV